MFYVYIIRSKEGFLYIGSTEDIQKRVQQHNAHLSFWTKRGTEWKVLHTETLSTRKDALIRERALKSGQGRAWIKKLLSSGS